MLIVNYDEKCGAVIWSEMVRFGKWLWPLPNFKLSLGFATRSSVRHAHITAKFETSINHSNKKYVPIMAECSNVTAILLNWPLHLPM